MAQLEGVRDAIHQQPFLPFRLRLVDGTEYLVKHPDFMALPPTARKRHVVLYDDAGVHLIDLGLVLEVILAAEPATREDLSEDDGH